MIDIHSHILPCLDDGARSMQESLSMLKMALATGTTDIIATPHSNSKFVFDAEVTEQRIAELQAASGNMPRIHYGCELHLTMEGIEDALRLPEKYTIGHRSYVLVEFSNVLVPKTTGEIFDQMLARGIRPIVAHPERNPLLRERMPELEMWVSQGCCLQVTAQSLLGRFGKSADAASHDLMERGLVHFLASDAHDLRHRPPILSGVGRYVEKAFDRETADRLLIGNPQAVLDGTPVATGYPLVRKKFWSLLW